VTAAVPEHSTLITERLTLRPWDRRCRAWLRTLATDAAVMRYIGYGGPWDATQVARAHERQLRHWAEHGFGWRTISETASGRLVGIAALNTLRAGIPGIGPSAYEIGWWVAPTQWGRGIAFEAAVVLCEEAFADVAATALVARVRPGNVASERVSAKLGLRFHADTVGASGAPVRVYVRER